MKVSPWVGVDGPVPMYPGNGVLWEMAGTEEAICVGVWSSLSVVVVVVTVVVVVVKVVMMEMITSDEVVGDHIPPLTFLHIFEVMNFFSFSLLFCFVFFSSSQLSHHISS